MKDIANFCTSPYYSDFTTPSYGDIINSFECESIFSEILGSYQGDELHFLKDKDGRYGILVFGYGSCSYCDALEGCSSVQDVKDLQESLFGSIEWGTKEETIERINGAEKRNAWTWHETGTKEFYLKILEYLSGVKND